MTRLLVAMAIAALVSIGSDASASECRPELLRNAIDAAGGARALRSVQTLNWHGTARIFAGAIPSEIGAATTVAPFVSARSDTWLLTDGPDKKRSLLLDGDQGWLERGGQRDPMPEPMRIHERQQYALYGLMLLVDACPRRPLRSTTPALKDLTGIEVTHDSAPVTTLYFDRGHRLVAATNRVTDPDDATKPLIDQRFEFSGEIVDNGVRWPRKITILQNEKPYFELTLTAFRVQIKR